MKTKEIQARLDRGYTMAIYGTRENINEQMTNDIKELLEAINYSQCCTELICDFDKINDGSLTKGKKYVKIHEHNGMVVIINDFDEVMSYNKESFFEAN